MRPLARPLAVLVALLAACGTALLPSAAHADDGQGAAPTDTPLVLAGVAGLRWSDVDVDRTPNLWRLVGGGSVASVAVRTLTPTCPVDAWLTISAGQRVSTGTGTGSPCADVPGTDPPGAGPGTAAVTVPGRDDLLPTEPLVPPVAEPGALGELVDVAGTCATAVGPGGAVALARDDGSVTRYLPDLEDLDADQVAACPATVVDLGSLPDVSTDRGAAVRELDDQVGELAALLPAQGRLVVAGIADTPQGPSDLQVVVDWTAPGGDATWLTSTSSRWTGVVVPADLAATVADTVTGGALSGAGPDGDDDGAAADDVAAALAPFTGSPLEHGADRRIPVTTTVENRQYLSVLNDTVPRLAPVLLGLVALVGLVVAAALVTARRLGSRSAPGDPGDPGAPGAPDAPGVVPAPTRPWRRVALAALMVATSLPVAASLATSTRWWAWPSPVLALLLALSVAALGVSWAGWAARRLLPASPWRVTTTLAAITWLVLTVDGLTGTTLQQGSLLGPSPSLGARFYGFSNTVFAVYAVAGLLLSAGLAATVRARGGTPGRAAGVAGAVGVVTVLVDGLPAFGADLGGIFALVPGFAVLVLGVAGTRMTWRRAVLVGAATVGVVVLVAVADRLVGGGSGHLGDFVQSILDGRAVGVVAGKATGAWATVAHPAGAVAVVVCAAAAWAVLSPGRAHLVGLADAYRRDPLLRRAVVALVVTAVVGTLLNDSGILVASLVLALSTPALLAGYLEDTDGRAGATAQARDAAVGPASEPGVRRLPTVLVTVSGATLVLLLLASSALGSAGLRAADDAADAGAQVAPGGAGVVAGDGPLVVVGTTGVRWDDVTQDRAPVLAGLLADGYGAGGTAQPTGAASRCAVGGWLALSAGSLTEVSPGQDDDGRWRCPTPRPVPADDGTGGAVVEGWDELVDLQRDSTYQAVLGSLGDQLAAAGCTTAVGPGAALALAGPDGEVARYRELDAATGAGTDAFDCPVTVVDAGDATAPAGDPDADAEQRAAAQEAEHGGEVGGVDATVGEILAAAPPSATVLVVDLAGSPDARPVLGVALARPGADAPPEPRFLTSAATRTDGVVRVLDVPSSILGAAGATPAAPVDDTPLVWGSPRPQDTAVAAQGLADLTTLDHARRAVYTGFVDLPLYAALVLAAACLLLGPRLARATGPRAPARRRAAWGWARGAALLLAALPTGAYLSSLTGWWRFDQPVLALVLSSLGTTAVVAAVGALAPRRPVWLGPGIVAAVTFAVLTLDALIGTPLNRASPLGSAPTFGARFYGFGNPTFSVYAVAALVTAGALAQVLVSRGRRAAATAAVGVIGVVAMVVDLWPTLGADLGGALVIAPAFAVLVLAASGARLTWRRFLAVAAAGVGVVAAVGVLDWLRPADERSHLGRFVGQVVDGTAWETLARKAGYALRSVLDGAPVWLTLVVLVAGALLLFVPARGTPRWFARTEAAWPLLRPTVLGLWIVCVAGSVVNDFGVRIAVIALVPAIPLLTVAALHTLWPTGGTADPAPLVAGRRIG
ncbi:hypothetical protein [Isoptericola aurantiacus]|uniref:hypothetical protein n=1 Tax=Isoptericola aurantiacus TaxID=3377839 RepID=UPI00383B69C3